MLALKRFERQFRGSSFPTEVVCDDGSPWILKMRGAGNGVHSLIAEFVVNRVASSLGWNVPDVELIEIPEGFPWTFGTDEFDDIVRRSFGINLGIAVISGAVPVLEPLSLSSQFLSRVAALDRFFLNRDRFAASQNLLIDSAGNSWAIDHGSCQFLHREACQRPLALHTKHFLFDQNLPFDPIDALADEELLEAAVGAAPEAWLQEAALTQEMVMENLRQRIKSPRP